MRTEPWFRVGVRRKCQVHSEQPNPGTDCSSSRSYPAPYTGATYAVLPGSTSNSTHWSITVLAQGLSSWGGTNLDPAGTISVAYAQSRTPPTEPANNASRFSIHNSHAKWTLDLKASQLANFAELVANASAPLDGGVGDA